MSTDPEAFPTFEENEIDYLNRLLELTGGKLAEAEKISKISVRIIRYKLDMFGIRHLAKEQKRSSRRRTADQSAIPELTTSSGVGIDRV